MILNESFNQHINSHLYCKLLYYSDLEIGNNSFNYYEYIKYTNYTSLLI